MSVPVAVCGGGEGAARRYVCLWATPHPYFGEGLTKLCFLLQNAHKTHLAIVCILIPSAPQPLSPIGSFQSTQPLS